MPNTKTFKGSEFEDVEYPIVIQDKVKRKMLSAKDQAYLLNQIAKEYDVCFNYTEAKRKMWLKRLRLYNNQKRNADAVGESLMFTIFNTIHASLWEDRLMATWEGRGGQGDEDVEENLNALSNFDYDVMQKAETDYDWNWDAEFFGRGLLLVMEFNTDKGKQCPSPENIDVTTWIRDPKACSVNGDIEGRGAMRFGGYEVGLSYWEMKDHPGYFNVDLLRKGKDHNSLRNAASIARAEAQGRSSFDTREEALHKYGNYEFTILRWFTHFRGEKIMVELGNQREMVVRIYKLNDRWPIIDRALYPMAHDWDGVSIPDLTEDKQRLKALLLNLAAKSAKSDVLPNYLYDASRITNRKDLNQKFNKFIPIQGRVDNAIMPVQKATLHQYVTTIMDMLDLSSQKALATPDFQSGVQSKQQRTLGEIEIVESKVDTRYSMSAKLYGLSEANFWRQWYWLYKKHFKGRISKKIVRIQGASAPIWRPMTRENIIAQVDPDVKIQSKIISEAKRVRERNDLIAFANVVIVDPETNRRFVEKKLAKLNGMSKEEVDAVFPPTIDELRAEEENIILNNEKMPRISIDDDHQTHLAIHSKANVSIALVNHIKTHRDLMMRKKSRPDLFPQMVPTQTPATMPGKTLPSPEKTPTI